MLLASLLLPTGLRAEEAGEEEPKEEISFRQALTGGDAKVGLRLRLETVDQASFAKDANALTLRTTLAYETLDYQGWSLFVEAENIAAVGNEDLYNNAGRSGLSNGVTDRPVVADAAVTEMNQVGLRYERGNTEVTLGRRELVIADSRFVGNVGWRQNHQAFDAFTVTHRPSESWEITYAYLSRVHRIFGDSLGMSSHLLRASTKLGSVGTLAGQALLLDYDAAANAGLSTATYGLELTGKRQLADGLGMLYEAELARQSDHADNPGNLDAGYYHLAFGLIPRGITVQLGWEVLEGDAEDGRFSTPLATLHKFNGWADQFLRTPADGLEDLYLKVAGKAGPVAWVAVYHDFSAESAGTDYGTEVDIQLTYQSPWSQQFGLKAALYDADQLGVDVDKLMVWTGYTF